MDIKSKHQSTNNSPKKRAWRWTKGRVFVDQTGAPRTYRQCNYALECICKRAELRPIQWHALRHTSASHLVMKGVPLKAVQELLGHGTQAMTERYAHLTPDVRRTAVDVLDSGNETLWSPAEH